MWSYRKRRLVVVILALVFAPGILWYGTLWITTLRSLPQMPAASGHETVWSSTEWSHIPAEGESCILANNVWNKRAAGHSFEQEVFVEDLDGKRTLGWRWRSPWQMWPSIAAYPELICGNKPWDEPIGTFAGMPFHPGARRLIADYNIQLHAVGRYNLAFSMWAVSELPATPEKIRCEVMIWIAGELQQPSGTRRGTVEVDGVIYDVWINPHQHDASGTNKNEWVYVAFVAQSPVLNGPLQIDKFLDTLGPLKILTPDLWITDVELGDEVGEGAGIAEVQDFALHLTDRDGAAPAMLPPDSSLHTDN